MIEISPRCFDIFLLIMSGIAAIVFVALYFLKAGYGIFRSNRWGVAIDNKIAWVLMEAPVFIVMVILWWNSERRFETVPLVIFIFFQLHYFQRSFIFPFLMKGKSRMPVTVMLLSLIHISHGVSPHCGNTGTNIFPAAGNLRYGYSRCA